MCIRDRQAQHLVDDGRGHVWAFSHRPPLQAQPLLAAFGAFAVLVGGVLAAGADALEYGPRHRRRYHLWVLLRLLLNHITLHNHSMPRSIKETWGT